jgi:hypothetical protein
MGAGAQDGGGVSNGADGQDPLLDGIARSIEEFRDEKNSTVMAYVLVAEFLDEVGDRRLFHDTFEGQRGVQTLGLLTYALTVEKRRVADLFMEDE